MSVTLSEQPPRSYLFQHYWLRVLKKRLIQFMLIRLMKELYYIHNYFIFRHVGDLRIRQCICNLRSKLTYTQNEKFCTLTTVSKISRVGVTYALRLLTFKRRIKSHLPFAGIIRNSPYSPRFQDNG